MYQKTDNSAASVFILTFAGRRTGMRFTMKKLFKGIMPALVTPIDKNGTFKSEVAESLLKWEISKGVHGFYINGATGEGLFLSEDVRKELAETSIGICKGKVKVINHVGAVDTMSAIRLAKHAGEIGCDAISSLVPNYLTTYTTDQVLDYYKRISDASGLPVLVYCKGNVGTTPYEFMKRVMNVNGLIGCKYTMFDYYSMHRITELNGGDINVINGPDEMLICGLTMGADGGIGSTYNIMGDWFVDLYNKYRSGDFEGAREVQFRINKVIAVILKYNCIPALKAALTLQGFNIGDVAYPGKVFSAEELEQFRKEMAEAGYSIIVG